MKHSLICKKCGKEYFVFKYALKTSKYCSKSCQSSDKISGDKSPWWKGGDKVKTCPRCGTEFYVHQNDTRRVYCSKDCHNKARQKRVNLTCVNCGKHFEQKISKSSRYKNNFCSHICYTTYSVLDKSHSWRGGLSFKPYPKTFNRRFKNQIRERDNYTCFICKKRGNNVHHINYVKDDTNPENCITLCRSCHCKTNFNREYWIQFFKS